MNIVYRRQSRKPASVNLSLTFSEKERELEKKAEIFGALSSPKRLRILLFLHRKGISNVATIWGELSLSQSSTSQHLRILLQTGLVKRKRIGTTMLYELTPYGKEVAKLIEGKDGRL